MLLAGADVSYSKNFAAAVIAEYIYPEEKLLEYSDIIVPVSRLFKYQAGLLFLRESPLLIEAYKSLRNKPEILIINGHGIAHPFNFGLASVIELALRIPTIGCAKEPLIGKYRRFQNKRGNSAYLRYNYKRIGLAICTKDGTKPLIISSGGILSLKEIKEIILITTTKFKFPMPLREADRISRQSLKDKEYNLTD